MIEPRAKRNQAVQRGFDILAGRPGKHVFASAWNEDAEISGAIADLLHLQTWRRDKGLSLATPLELLATAKDVWIVEDTFTSPEQLELEGEAS